MNENVNNVAWWEKLLEYVKKYHVKNIALKEMYGALSALCEQKTLMECLMNCTKTKMVSRIILKYIGNVVVWPNSSPITIDKVTLNYDLNHVLQAYMKLTGNIADEEKSRDEYYQIIVYDFFQKDADKCCCPEELITEDNLPFLQTLIEIAHSDFDRKTEWLSTDPVIKDLAAKLSAFKSQDK